MLIIHDLGRSPSSATEAQWTYGAQNAVEHRRIPLRFLWMPLAKAQEGLGGKARAIWMAVCIGLTALISALVLVPYPLKMDANGDLLPVVRRKMTEKYRIEF